MMRLARLALTAIFLGAGAIAPALAADVVKPIVAPPAIVPVVAPLTWTGHYIGGFMGAGWAKHTWSIGPSGGEEQDPGEFMGRGTSTGALAGGQIGANWQHGTMVFGLQGDLAWADIHGTAANPDSPVSGNCWAPDADQTASCGARVNLLGSATVKAGLLLHPDFLLYAKGGLGFDHTSFTVTGLTPGGGCVPQGPDYAPVGQTRTGWTVGVGGEKKFNPHASGFLEYDYSDFGNKLVGFADPGGNGCSTAFNAHISQTVQVVKLGIDWMLP